MIEKLSNTLNIVEKHQDALLVITLCVVTILIVFCLVVYLLSLILPNPISLLEKIIKILKSEFTEFTTNSWVKRIDAFSIILFFVMAFICIIFYVAPSIYNALFSTSSSSENFNKDLLLLFALLSLFCAFVSLFGSPFMVIKFEKAISLNSRINDSLK